MPFLFSLLIIALMIGALIDIITRDDAQVKHLPKMVWLIIVILLPLVGSLLWFALGREYGEGGVPIPRMRRVDRPAAPTVAPSPARPVDTRTTEQQIADLDREIEEWRLREELEKRRREQGDAPGAGA
ncbi:PLD nuclease N-terminal domain-containing protein [Microbacterium paraoxydans]|uniref:PLDc_N domain-containing protein n=1 Tax=Microbacterium paraoxydans TaxID=199592 RepID=A0ABS5IRL6_9MICO|nr:PLD nuclease N-terminal domain-containing protein [Microbacterium paraoxydans]MBS0025495.1 PLDc_N domain-containing protein [Microbacterium paraoxydans]